MVTSFKDAFTSPARQAEYIDPALIQPEFLEAERIQTEQVRTEQLQAEQLPAARPQAEQAIPCFPPRTTLVPKPPVRPHKKSRDGCKTCKKRKVKCDEAKPECGGCIRFGVRCDFSAFGPPLAQDASKTQSAPNGARRNKRIGRPRSDWSSWTEEMMASSEAAEKSSRRASQNGAAPSVVPKLEDDISSGQNSITAGPDLNVEDLELFHHYMSQAGKSFDDGGALWCHRAPLLGTQHPCVFHIMLAFSAYHLCRLKPAKSKRFLELGEKHSTLAVRKATELLPCLNDENSPALYVTAVLVCFTSFAKGPSEGQLLIAAGEGQVSWLALFRGVRFVIETTGWSAIYSGPLADVRPGIEPEPKREEVEDQTPLAEIEAAMSLPSEDVSEAMQTDIMWEESLRQVSDQISILEDAEKKEIYKRQVQMLSSSFAKTFGTATAPEPHVKGQFQFIMSWMYSHNETSVALVESRDPIALVLLGHFCVLVRTLESYWFMEGWASHILGEICRSSTECVRWLAWPLRYLGMDVPMMMDENS